VTTLVYEVGGLVAVVKIQDTYGGLRYDSKGNIEESDYKISAACEIGPPERGNEMPSGNYGRIIVFKDGKRIAKRVHRTKMKEATQRVLALREKGIKAHIAYLTESRKFPPPRTVKPMREEGKYWCPYCGAWRWFSIPAYKSGPVAIMDGDGLLTDQFYMNSCALQQIHLCQWCTASISDFYVIKANGLWGEGLKKRKVRARTRQSRRRRA
jgi:hypothetical protein